MEVQFYRAVAEQRGDYDPDRLHPHADHDVEHCTRYLCGFDADDHQDDAALYLRQDLASLKAVWYRNYWRDWWAFMKNMHPLFAMFWSHDLHVISRCERWYINLLLLFIALDFAALATKTQQCNLHNSVYCDTDGPPPVDPCLAACAHVFHAHVGSVCWFTGVQDGANITGSCRLDKGHNLQCFGPPELGPQGGGCGPNGNHVVQYGFKAAEAPSQEFCCFVNQWGFVWFYDNWGGYGVTVYCAVLTIAFSQVLCSCCINSNTIPPQLCFQTAALGCVQRCSDTFRYRAEHVGHFALFCYGIFLIIWMPYYSEYLGRNGLWGTTLLNFLLTKLFSEGGAVLLISLLFHLLWHWQKMERQWWRMGVKVGMTFYISWDDEDAQELARSVLGIDTATGEFVSTKEEPVLFEFQGRRSSVRASNIFVPLAEQSPKKSPLRNMLANISPRGFLGSRRRDNSDHEQTSLENYILFDELQQHSPVSSNADSDR